MAGGGKRAYVDGCAVAHALNLVGERWALLIVRDLLLGPKRFTDLQAGLPGAGPNILAQRLRDLERAGVVRRRTLAPPAGSRVYELTEWGAELDLLIGLLARWGSRSPILSPSGRVGADSLVLGLRTFFEPDPADPWTASYEVHIDEQCFMLGVAGGRLTTVARGQWPGEPDVLLKTDAATFDALSRKEQLVRRAQRAGLLTLTGDIDAAQRLFQTIRM